MGIAPIVKNDYFVVTKPFQIPLLVHNDYASMMIQQNKETVNDDDKGAMSSMEAQKIIQQLLLPYEIRFLEIYDYCYWKGKGNYKSSNMWYPANIYAF